MVHCDKRVQKSIPLRIFHFGNRLKAEFPNFVVQFPVIFEFIFYVDK